MTERCQRMHIYIYIHIYIMYTLPCLGMCTAPLGVSECHTQHRLKTALSTNKASPMERSEACSGRSDAVRACKVHIRYTQATT